MSLTVTGPSLNERLYHVSWTFLVRGQAKGRLQPLVALLGVTDIMRLSVLRHELKPNSVLP